MNNQIDINNEIKVLMNHFNAKQFDFVIQKSLKLVKKFPKVIILYNLLGSSLQNIGNLKDLAFCLVKNILWLGYHVEKEPATVDFRLI